MGDPILVAAVRKDAKFQKLQVRTEDSKHAVILLALLESAGKHTQVAGSWWTLLIATAVRSPPQRARNVRKIR